MDVREVIETAFRVYVRADIEQAKTEGPPEAVGLVPADDQADYLMLLRWKAARRDCTLLYEGEEIYEKHIDDLRLDDGRGFSSFCSLLANAMAQSGAQIDFMIEVTDDIEALPGDDNPERGGEE